MKHFFAILFFFCFAAFARDDGQLLISGSEALGKRVSEIRLAKREILVSSFILKDHASSRLILAELLRAKARGVDVKILMDQAGVLDKRSQKVLATLNEKGVQVKVYNPFKRFWKLNVRNHGKLFVVDGKSFITGGRNLWDESFGIGKKSHDDLEVYVQGDSAEKVRDYFYKLWKSEAAWDFKKKSIGHFDTIDELRALTRQRGFDLREFKIGLRGEAPMDPIGRVEVIGDEAGSEGRRHREQLYRVIKGAEETLKIETPWIIPTGDFANIVEMAREKLIELKILTNSPESSEKPFRAFLSRLNSWALSQSRPWIIFEKQTGRSLHSKYTLIDGLKAYIGSFNFSPRSEVRNLEAGVLIENSPLVDQLDELFMKRASISKPMPYQSWLEKPCSTVLSLISRSFY